jgi:molecular chaperone GrpE (heat shock protein)
MDAPAGSIRKVKDPFMTATELLIDPGVESDEATTPTGDQTPEVIMAAATPALAAEPVPTETDTALAALTGRVTAAEDRLDSVEGRLSSTEGRLGATDAAVTTVGEQVESITVRLATVDERLAAVDHHIAALHQAAAAHDHALADVSRSIAAEVERHTSDALVDSQHSLQLAVNSIAQLALAMAESSRDITEDISAESATALLDSFRIDLDAILAQLGFESLATAVGATFDPHWHRALKRVPTTDAAADKVITRVIRDGYRSAATGRILLFADVEVSRYLP